MHGLCLHMVVCILPEAIFSCPGKGLGNLVLGVSRDLEPQLAKGHLHCWALCHVG
jgi:hypothetical protein